MTNPQNKILHVSGSRFGVKMAIEEILRLGERHGVLTIVQRVKLPWYSTLAKLKVSFSGEARNVKAACRELCLEWVNVEGDWLLDEEKEASMKQKQTQVFECATAKKCCDEPEPRPCEDAIRERAYELYLLDDQSELNNWLRAERELTVNA